MHGFQSTQKCSHIIPPPTHTHTSPFAKSSHCAHTHTHTHTHHIPCVHRRQQQPLPPRFFVSRTPNVVVSRHVSLDVQQNQGIGMKLHAYTHTHTHASADRRVVTHTTLTHIFSNYFFSFLFSPRDFPCFCCPPPLFLMPTLPAALLPLPSLLSPTHNNASAHTLHQRLSLQTSTTATPPPPSARDSLTDQGSTPLPLIFFCPASHATTRTTTHKRDPHPPTHPPTTHPPTTTTSSHYQAKKSLPNPNLVPSPSLTAHNS